MRLLAKDGVFLSTVPRVLDTPQLLFAFGSRVEAAVWCPAGTFNMGMVLLDYVDQGTMTGAGPDLGALVAVRRETVNLASSVLRRAGLLVLDIISFRVHSECPLYALPRFIADHQPRLPGELR